MTWLVLTLAVLPAFLAGSLLPFWIMLHSLQLASHTILFKSLMPAHTHNFLKAVNDALRWYSRAFWEQMDRDYGFKRYEIGFGGYTPMFEQAGYLHLFSQNLVIYLIVLGCFIVVCVLLAVKDRMFSKATGG